MNKTVKLESSTADESINTIIIQCACGREPTGSLAPLSLSVNILA